ncbi:rhomboid family protein [Flavobacterium sp. '19STA2R22 D10 B1']|uniref:rhomboid family protein n=1 Tax=Flavobacterium aerium TaxID=3037261 RepID=UPI00278C7EDF|nr:rhomboid family intramembrane serine protease [Flavobacterium sp. '19STA2R22 D10 B1']
MNILDDLKLQYKMGGIAQRLIFWNIGLYIVSLIFFYSFQLGIFNLPNWLALSSDPLVVLVRPWTLLTYAFFHAGFLHLLFNMMVLHFASRLFLTYFTQKQFLGLYLLSAIFAGIIFVLSYVVLGNVNIIVGASGAIMAILVGVATYAPYMQLRLLLIGNVKLWHVAFVIVLLDLIQLPMGNTGGHIAHLGGAFFGFFYIKMLQNGTDLTKGITAVLDWAVTLFKPRKSTPFKKVHKNKTSPNFTPTSRATVTKDKSQQQIDEILDKISQSGYDSLSKEEKEFLFKAGK